MADKEYLKTGLEIAVIGMDGRFPGAKNIHEFWENLKNSVPSITFFSNEELKEAGIPLEILNDANYVKAKGFVEDIEYFDALFFGFKPLEAEKLDPQVRIFYQCVWHALEDAGYSPEKYNGLIGLYAGATPNIKWEAATLFNSSKNIAEYFASTHFIDKDYMCTGISYKLNLKGPSFSVHTACSTSLVTIHLACQAILSGECDIALAGGVSITVPKKSGYLFQEGLIVSPDGYCRVFDQNASGTAFGNGAGVVVLKSLEDAINDSDTIHAVIKGSAINNDGNRKVGFTAPSAKGQAEVIRAAYQAAEVNPETINYVEAHGTGTALGDPIELEALTLAFDTDKKQYCRMGSVKSNVGHLDCAAGAAGFIKTVLTLKHQLIPPSLHVENPNPKIDFKNSPFQVNTQLTPLENSKYPLRAAVNSFGVGGTNAHVILEEWPTAQGAQRKAQSEERMEHGAWRNYQLILLSAKTVTALERMTQNLADHLKRNPDINLADAAYTLQVGREAFQHRRSMVCLNSDVNDAIEALSHPGPGRMQTFYSQKGNPPVVFMFSDQGSQYVNMGLELYQAEPVFKEMMDHCFNILKPLMAHDIKEILYPTHPVPSGHPSQEGSELTAAPSNPQPAASFEKINQTEIAQPVIFAFEYALAKLLIKWGIHPYALIGHSIGEYTAACISGVLSLEDALKIVVLRGQLMQQMPPGAMLSTKLPGQQVQNLLNGQEEVEWSMEPIIEEFREKIGTLNVKFNKPEIPYISNVTGELITAEQAADPGYWADHLRRTVRFADGLSELLKELDAVFVEIGPGSALSTFLHRHTGIKPGHNLINLIPHPQENVSAPGYLLSKLGQLWVYGKNLDWEEFHSGRRRFRIPLPKYPFEGQRFWKYIDNYLKNEVNDQNRQWPPETTTGEIKEEEPREHRARPDLTTPFVEPNTPLEKKLADTCQKFLGIDRVGIHDNFFELGASSLDLVRLGDEFKEVVGKDIPVVDLFRYPMIHLLAKNLDDENSPDSLAKEEKEKKKADEMQKGRKAMQNRLQLTKK